MKPLLTNTTGALLVTLIVSAVTSGSTDRNENEGHKFDRTFDALTPDSNNASLLHARPAVQCGAGNCKGRHISKRLHPEFHASFTNADLQIIAKPVKRHFLVIFLMSILAGAASTVTIAGNVVVIIALFIELRLRRSTNYYLMSLAISDLWIGVGSIPLYTHYLIEGYWALGRFVCNLWLVLDWTICAASQYTVFMITLDRYLSVTAPVVYRNKRTDNKVLGAIAIAWIIPCCIFPPLIMTYQPEGYVVVETECGSPFLSDAWITFIVIFLYHWVFTILMCYFYWNIYQIASVLRLKTDIKSKGRELFTDNSNINNSLWFLHRDHSRHLHKNANYGKRSTVSKTATNASPDCPLKVLSCGDSIALGDESLESFCASNELNSTKTCNSLPSNKNNNSDFTKSTADGGTSATKETASTVVNHVIQDSEVDSLPQLLGLRHSSVARVAVITSPEDLLNINRTEAETEEVDGSPIDPSIVHFSQSHTHSWTHRDSVISPNYPKAVYRDQRIFNTISVVLGAYLFCWTPFHIVMLLPALCGYDCVNKHVYELAYGLCYLNSTINPFLYAYANDKFRLTLVRVMKCRIF